MQLLGPQVVSAYAGKILNSHPALFSSSYKGQSFYGDAVYEQVLAHQETTTGVTIHLVDEQYDHGAVLGETSVPITATDTVATLKQKVQEQERQLYIYVLQQIIAEQIEL